MIGMTTIVADHLAKYLDVGVVTEAIGQDLKPPVVIVKNVSMRFDKELNGHYWGHYQLQIIYLGDEDVTDQEVYSVIGERLSFVLEEVAYSDGVIRAESMDTKQIDANTVMVLVTYRVRIEVAEDPVDKMEHLKQGFKSKKESGNERL